MSVAIAAQRVVIEIRSNTFASNDNLDCDSVCILPCFVQPYLFDCVLLIYFARFFLNFEERRSMPWTDSSK